MTAITVARVCVQCFLTFVIYWDVWSSCIGNTHSLILLYCGCKCQASINWEIFHMHANQEMKWGYKELQTHITNFLKLREEFARNIQVNGDFQKIWDYSTVIIYVYHDAEFNIRYWEYVEWLEVNSKTTWSFVSLFSRVVQEEIVVHYGCEQECKHFYSSLAIVRKTTAFKLSWLVW